MQAGVGQVRERLDSNNDRRVILTGTAWGVVGATIQQAAPLLGNIVVARVLGIEEFGRYSICFAGANTLAVMGGSTLSMYATSSIAANRRHGVSAVGEAVSFTRRWGGGVACVLSAVLFIVMSRSEAGVGGKVVNQVEAALAALICLATGLHTVGVGIVLGLERFSAASRMQAVRGGVCALGAIVGAAGGGTEGALAGLWGTCLISLAYTEIAVRVALAKEGVGGTRSPSRSNWQEIRSMVAPGLVGSVMVTPSPWLVQLMLVQSAGGLKQVALFQATMMIRQLLAFLPAQLGQAGLPVFSRLAVRHGGNSSLRNSLLKRSCLFACLSSLLLAGGMTLAGGHVMRLFGAGFGGSRPALMAALLAGVLLATETPLAAILVAERRMWTGVALNAIWLVALVCGLLWLVGKLEGALAANLAYGLAYAVHGLTTAVVIGRLTAGEGAPANSAAANSRED